MRRRDLIAFAAAALAPLRLRAQQSRVPVIGYLDGRSPGLAAAFVAAFRQGVSQTGFVEGQNLVIEYRWAEGRYNRLLALAAELVNRKADVIAAISPPSALAAKNATSMIPIVFVVGSDPVELGLVASLAHPGGNLTGISFLTVELLPKLLELLSELAPQGGVIAALVNPNNPNTERNIADVLVAARAKGVRLHILRAGTEGEIDAAFAALDQQRAGGLLVGSDPFLTSQRERLVAQASRHAVPAIYASREFVTAGGLISYGASLATAFRQLGTYAGKVLHGASPADLPVMQPDKFELVINLKTARALGLTVPLSLLARADEVIE
jgi:putative ABC transport system substrate-binding protein